MGRGTGMERGSLLALVEVEPCRQGLNRIDHTACPTIHPLPFVTSAAKIVGKRRRRW